MHERAVAVDRLRLSPARADRVVIGEPSWWQWPTILSLDAPSVAIVWQALLARAAGVSLGWPQQFVLAASVWLAYAADRWIEGWRIAPADVRTQRHHFAQRWRWPLAACWSLVFAADVAVAFGRLSAREIGSGAVLLALVVAYLLSHQSAHRESRWRVPKELCIAFLMASGAGVFLVTPGDVAALSVPLVMFGLACLGNCALISAWERDVDLAHGEDSLALRFRLGGALGRSLPWALAALAAMTCGLAQGPLRDAAGCALATGLLLGAVDLAETRLGPQLAHVLADAALMTPLLVWLPRL
jgi:hypothetical protein